MSQISAFSVSFKVHLIAHQFTDYYTASHSVLFALHKLSAAQNVLKFIKNSYLIMRCDEDDNEELSKSLSHSNYFPTDFEAQIIPGFILASHLISRKCTTLITKC